MDNYINLMKNNSSETYTPVQTRNAMVNKYNLNNKINVMEKLKVNLINRGFIQTFKLQTEVRDLTKFSIIRNEVKLTEINDTLKSIRDLMTKGNNRTSVSLIENKPLSLENRVTELKNESRQIEEIKTNSRMSEKLKESLENGFEKLGDRLERLPKMNNETMLALGIMLIQKLQQLGFNKDTFKGLTNIGNIGKLLYKDIAQSGINTLKVIGNTGKGVINAFRNPIKSVINILKPIQKPLTIITDNLKSVFNTIKSTTNTLKSGMGKAIDFISDVGAMMFKVLEKIPGMSSLLKSLKFIGKNSGLLTAGFMADDFGEGVVKSEQITGQKNNNIGQKIGAGTINAGTGYLNSISEGVNFLTGNRINLGRIDPKGVYNAITGSSNLSGSEITTLQGKYKKRNGKPVDNMNITSYPGGRSKPNAMASSNHAGTDIAVPVGTPVYSTANGVVTFAGTLGLYGLTIKIRHANNFETTYAHLSKILVNNGEFIYEGQEIAKSGNTGNSTGPHLHYELRQNGKPLNPFAKPTEKQLEKYDMHSNIRQPMPLPAPNPNKSNISDLAYKGIIKNEGNVNLVSINKDNIGYTFGRSQFNSATNPQAWKDLGFTDKQIKDINSGNFNKQNIENILKSKLSKINEMDLKQKNSLSNYVTTFFAKEGMDISDPYVFAQLMDITNQYSKVFDKKTIEKLKSSSKGNKVTLQAIKDWRMSTLQGKNNPQDQLRRFNNINQIMNENKIDKPILLNKQKTKPIQIASTEINNITKPQIEKYIRINDNITYPKQIDTYSKTNIEAKKINERLKNNLSLTNIFQKSTSLVRSSQNIRDVNSIGNLIRQGGNLTSSFLPKEQSKNILNMTNYLPSMLSNTGNIIPNIQRGNIAGGITSVGNILKNVIKLSKSQGSDLEINPNLEKAGQLTMGNVGRYQNTIKSISNAIAKPNLNNIMSAGTNLITSIPSLLGISENLFKSTNVQPISPVVELEKEIMYGKKKENQIKTEVKPQSVPIMLANNNTRRDLDMTMTIEDFPMLAVASGVFD